MSVKEKFFEAVARGDMGRVNQLMLQVTGVGIAPPRLSLLKDKNADGKTAEDMATQAGHQEIANLLKAERLRMEHCE